MISTQVPPLTPLGVDKAIAQRLRDARSVEYCAFKACEDIPRAFQRDDLRWARSGSVGVGPFRNACQGSGQVIRVRLGPGQGLGLALLSQPTCMCMKKSIHCDLSGSPPSLRTSMSGCSRSTTSPATSALVQKSPSPVVEPAGATRRCAGSGTARLAGAAQ